ncbi:MAG: undecaprenyldiphospho-muramoylpentapeptide beta-N-acetylglucosaminyltransferase [Microbacteriaceae bacterium]
MTRYLLAGGGTAGHVNPLLAVADTIRRREPESTILILGTEEGLEARLVPERGYQLLTVPKVPFPRRPGPELLTFLPKLRRAIRRSVALMRKHEIDIVVGFGGFASAPAYLAAKKLGLPLVIHEANIKPGMANKLGARYTQYLGVSFAETRFGNARLIGTPLRSELENFDREQLRVEARSFFDLGKRKTLLVTGGSQGALRINQTIEQRLAAIIDQGYQIIHLIGGKNTAADFKHEWYRPLNYLDRMELALALADLAIARAGATTVSEFAAIGLPAVFVPLPHGNGEQRLNAREMIETGGAIAVENSEFTPEWIDRELLPLLRDDNRLSKMHAAAQNIGIPDGASRMFDLIQDALHARPIQ